MMPIKVCFCVPGFRAGHPTYPVFQFPPVQQSAASLAELSQWSPWCEVCLSAHLQGASSHSGSTSPKSRRQGWQNEIHGISVMLCRAVSMSMTWNSECDPEILFSLQWALSHVCNLTGFVWVLTTGPDQSMKWFWTLYFWVWDEVMQWSDNTQAAHMLLNHIPANYKQKISLCFIILCRESRN